MAPLFSEGKQKMSRYNYIVIMMMMMMMMMMWETKAEDKLLNFLTT